MVPKPRAGCTVSLLSVLSAKNLTSCSPRERKKNGPIYQKARVAGTVKDRTVVTETSPEP